MAAEVAKRLGASVTFWDRIVSTIGGFLNGLRDLVVKGVGGYLTGLWDMGAGSDRYEMRLDPITPPQQADTGQDQQQEQGQQQEQTQQQSGGEQQAPPLASTFSFAENPFVCDGPSRPFGRLYGATPGERITFTSPDVGDLLPGTADGHGELGLIWQCNPNEAGRTWTVTASGSPSGRKGTFSVTGAAPLGGDGTQSETWPETTGGVTHTWSDWTNAGGVEGPTIPAVTTVQIACKLPGFRVADGNTWWYRIASSPWNGQFYVSADPFYNNGATSGPLLGTPFVDSAVRDC